MFGSQIARNLIRVSRVSKIQTFTFTQSVKWNHMYLFKQFRETTALQSKYNLGSPSSILIQNLR